MYIIFCYIKYSQTLIEKKCAEVNSLFEMWPAVKVDDLHLIFNPGFNKLASIFSFIWHRTYQVKKKSNILILFDLFW